MSEAAAHDEPEGGREVVAIFHKPRLPWHPAIGERFGVDRGQWKVLVEAIFPAAESADAVVMALSYCKARNLDPFKRPVQIVPIYDRKRGAMVETVWPGISELRTTAIRTGNFAGFDATEFGPLIDDTLSGTEIKYPEWAQCTVYRVIGGTRVPFVGPKVYWLETYATAKRDTAAPNQMWKKRPRGQLEKCAEAAALRRAFPEELGNEYAAEEIEGQALGTIREMVPVKSEVRARLEAREEAAPGGFSTATPEAALAEAEAGDEAEDAETPELGAEIIDTEATPAEPTTAAESYLLGEIAALQNGKDQAEIAGQDKTVKAALKEMGGTQEQFGRWNAAYLEMQTRLATKKKAAPKP